MTEQDKARETETVVESDLMRQHLEQQQTIIKTLTAWKYTMMYVAMILTFSFALWVTGAK